MSNLAQVLMVVVVVVVVVVVAKINIDCETSLAFRSFKEMGDVCIP
jgi:hypothetical protein